MSPSFVARAAAVVGALALAAGGVALWVSAGDAPAEATRVAAAPLPPADDAEPLFAPAPTAPKSREEKRFARIDRDDDGRITQAEYLALRRRNYDKLDVDGDGKLGFEEYAVAGLAKFAKADADASGQLAPSEFATTAPPPRKVQTAAACNCPQVAAADAE
jgi:hypothetical protein